MLDCVSVKLHVWLEFQALWDFINFGWWINILGIVGDHPLQAEWQSLGRWVTIHRKVGDQIFYGGWLTFRSWLTIHCSFHVVLTFWDQSRCQIPTVVEHPRDCCEHPKDDGWQSWGCWVTILWKLGDHILEGGWTSLGWWWPSWGWCLTVHGSCYLVLIL